MCSLTWRPSSPPCALTSLAHSSYPRSNACPSAEKSLADEAVRDSDTPIVTGPAAVAPASGATPASGPWLPPQAARKPANRIAVALMAGSILGHRNRSGRTPGPSFLLVEDWPGCQPPGRAGAHVQGLYRTDTRSAQHIL